MRGVSYIPSFEEYYNFLTQFNNYKQSSNNMEK
jgi:hypothetical protein